MLAKLQHNPFFRIITTTLAFANKGVSAAATLALLPLIAMYQYPDPTDYCNLRFPHREYEAPAEHPDPPFSHSYTPPQAMHDGDRLMFPMSRWVPPYGTPTANTTPLKEHQYVSPAMPERGWEVREDAPPQGPLNRLAPVVSPYSNQSVRRPDDDSSQSQYRSHGFPSRTNNAVQFVHQDMYRRTTQNTPRPSSTSVSHMQHLNSSFPSENSRSLRKSVLLQQAQSAQKPPVGMLSAGPRHSTQLPIHPSPAARAMHENGKSAIPDHDPTHATASNSAQDVNNEAKVAPPSPSQASHPHMPNTPPSPGLPLRLHINTSSSEMPKLPDPAADNERAVKRVHFLDDPVTEFREVTRLPRSHFGHLNATAPMGAPIEDDEV